MENSVINWTSAAVNPMFDVGRAKCFIIMHPNVRMFLVDGSGWEIDSYSFE